MANYRWEFEATGATDAVKMATALDRMDKSAKALTPALQTLTTTFSALVTGLKPVGDAFTKAAEGADAFRKAIQPLLRYIERHAEGFRLLTASSATMSRATQSVTANLRQQTAAAASHTTVINQGTTVINNYGRAVQDAGNANRQFHGGLLQTLGAWNTINKAADFAVKRYGQVKDAMLSVFRNTQQYGGAFESAERQLGVFMGAKKSPEAQKQFEETVKVAEKTAMETTVGGADALNAAIAASKAGMKGGDIAKALPTIVNASIAEKMSTSKIAEIGAITSSQFQRTGLGKGGDGKTIAADAAGSIKVLQATAAASSTDINTLFESMKNSASGATMLGMQLDEVAATLAVLSQNGETGGRAGTRLMMAFSRMATQSPQAKKAMDELGVSFKNSKGDVLPFTQILDTLNVKLAGVQGNAQKMTYLKQIFGESFSSMAFLVEQGGDAIKKSMQDIKDSMSIGDELKSENMAGMAGAFESFKGSYEQVYVSLRKVLTIPISNYFLTVANALNAVSARFSKVGDAFKNADTVEKWLDALKNADFSDAFSGLSEEFEKQIAVLKKLATGVWELIKKGFAALWKEIDAEKVMQSVASGVGKFSGMIVGAIFTPENMAAATKFGIEVGKQILAGLTESSAGLSAIFAGAGVALGGETAQNALGTLSGWLDKFEGDTESAAEAAPAATTTRRRAPASAGAEPARVGFSAPRSRSRAMTDADTGQRWRVRDESAGRSTASALKSALGSGLNGLKLVAQNAEMAIATGVFLGNFANVVIDALARRNEKKEDARGLQATRDALVNLNIALGKTTDPTKRAALQERIRVQEKEFERQTGKSYQAWQKENTTGKQAEQVKQLEEAQARRAKEARTPKEKMEAAGMTPEQIQRVMGWDKERKAAPKKGEWLETTTAFDKETRIAELRALDPLISALEANAIATREETEVRKSDYVRWSKAEQAKGQQEKVRQDYLKTAWKASPTGKIDYMTKRTEQELLQNGFSPQSKGFQNAIAGVKDNAVMQMDAAQYSRYAAAYAKAKASEGRATDAQKRLADEKEIYELKKKEAETQAQIANAPIDLKMQQNATNAGFSKWLLEPINKFREAISGVIGKFMGVFEGLGKQRTEAGVKSGRLTEEGAKKESAQVLEGSVTRAQKMLKLAQTPGQKAEAMQTQADKLLELSELTGDKSKAKQADELLKRAQAEQGKQEEIEIRKVELDRKLAKDNMKLLEGKQDGSASEAAARLKQLMESAMELGDVGKASQYKAHLQEAERKAAGEQVGVLKQILQELQLSRKSNDLAMTEQTDAMKQGTAQQVDKLTAIQNNSGGYDPAYATP